MCDVNQYVSHMYNGKYCFILKSLFSNECILKYSIFVHAITLCIVGINKTQYFNYKIYFYLQVNTSEIIITNI